MVRSELVMKLMAANRQLTRNDAEAIVATFFREITLALSRGDRVELRGLGSFSARSLPTRTFRNVHTGKAYEVPRKRYPVFHAGKLWFGRLNDPGETLPGKGKRAPAAGE